MRTIQYGLVNSVMGQIPCSTERISCLKCFCAHFLLFVSSAIVLIKTIYVDIHFIYVQYSCFCGIHFNIDCQVWLETVAEFMYFLLPAL